MCCDWSRGEGARIYQLWRAVCRVQPGAGLQPGEHRGPLNTDQGLHCGNSGGTLAIWCNVGTVAVVITLHGGNICTLCIVARDNAANCGGGEQHVTSVHGCDVVICLPTQINIVISTCYLFFIKSRKYFDSWKTSSSAARLYSWGVRTP